MGKIRFGNNPDKTPVAKALEPLLEAELVAAYKEDAVLSPSVWDNFTPEQAEKLLNPSTVEYVEVEKIVYVDKPVEVIKYVDREVIVEKPVIVEKIVTVQSEPVVITKEVIVEKPVTVETIREIEVVNPLNKYMVAVIVALGAIIILQGLL